ncbi:MAG TPA: AraC family transcriptional regulator [Bauldia sp.]|nr:AraC family transcriptional regulator [Bauldia sp.]
MNAVENALWFVENHFGRDDVSLDEVAAAAGVSRFHLSHVFTMATGRSVMNYMRARRLTEAARKLAAGAPDILGVALDCGYGSHEAFTRAFRDQFGTTPEDVRARGSLANLSLVEPIRMDRSLIVPLEPPRFEDAPSLMIAGLSGRYTFETNHGIPTQWQRFNAEFNGHIPNQKGNIYYGLSHNFDDDGHFEYVCGCEVSGFGELPDALARVRIASHRYAVFSHRGHISMISRTHYTIWATWAAESGFEAAEMLNFERYDERFDPMTGNGVVEIWVPVKT